jgi:multicomponent Na+:H+ antiporter subunit B
MTSVILRTISRFLLVLLTLFSLFILLRGHNEPGGGFIGGLLVAGAFALYALAHGASASRTLLRVSPRTILAVGLALALFSGLVPMLAGHAPLAGLWLPFPIPGVGKVGTVLLFDVGVYLVVLGASLAILYPLAEVD